MVERLFSGRSLDKRPVRAGDFVDARIDSAMCHYQYMDIHRMAVEAGFADGFPRVITCGTPQARRRNTRAGRRVGSRVGR
jgi:hypothetical protein